MFGIGELCGIAVGGADAQRHRRARRHRDAAEFDRLDGHAVAELVRAFEAQNSSTAVLISAGSPISRCFCGRIARQRHQPVADQIGGGLVAGVEQEDAVVQQFLRRSAARHCLRPGSAASARRVRDCRAWRAAARPDFEIGEKILHRRVAAGKHLRRYHRLQRAEDRQRPVAQRLASSTGTSSRLPITSIGIAAAKSSIGSNCPWPRCHRAADPQARSGQAPCASIARGDSAPMIAAAPWYERADR